jgi:hypothetical protein
VVDVAGRFAMYRWARSGLSGVKSQALESSRAGHTVRVSNGDGSHEDVGVTGVEAAAFDNPDLARVQRAARKVREARVAFDTAIRLLSPREDVGVLEEDRSKGWVSKRERERLVAAKARRESRGEGWGDG